MKQETIEEVELAILFHDTYERLAPSFGYETRADTKLFETTTPNGMLMIAVSKVIIKWMQERMYSEAIEFGKWLDENMQQRQYYPMRAMAMEELFKQFKKHKGGEQ